jgi:hypothetical protein
MPKALVIDDNKKYLDIPESFIKLKQSLGDVEIISQEVEKLLRSGITQLPQPIHEVGGVYSREGKPRKYTKPRSLKELIRDSQDPKLEVYQRLIKLWPQIPENRLKEVIEHVDPSILRKILDLSEAMNRGVEFLEEFLVRDLTYSQHIMLDGLYRHYFVLAPKYVELVKQLKDGVRYPIEVDSKKYDFEVFFFVDGVRMPIDFYVDGWEKTLGLEYRFMPCVENIRKRIRELTSTINKEAENTSLEKIEQLRYALIDLEKAGKELIRINPNNIVSFPPRYNVHRFYVSEQKQPLPCEYCNTHHIFTTIIKW